MRIIGFIKKPYIMWPAILIVLVGIHISQRPGYADNHPPALIVDYHSPSIACDYVVPVHTMKQALCAAANHPELSANLRRIQTKAGYRGWNIRRIATGRMIRPDHLTLASKPYEWQVAVRSESGILPSYACTVTVIPSGELRDTQCGYNK